jgi:hypothetical protein
LICLDDLFCKTYSPAVHYMDLLTHAEMSVHAG